MLLVREKRKADCIKSARRKRMSKIEQLRKEKKEMIASVPELEDGDELSWSRRMVQYFYQNKAVQDYWPEIVKKNGAMDTVQETLEITLSSTTIETDNPKDKKAIKRTLDNGTFLYFSDYVRLLNLVVDGKVK